MNWVESAPRNLQIAEYKLRGLTEPLDKLQKAAQEVDQATNVEGEGSSQTVEVEEQSISEMLMNRTQVFVSGLLVTLFLLYFLLASGDLFLRKVVKVLPQFRHRRNAVRIVRRTEEGLTNYLSTFMLINVGLGVALSGAMFLLGMPNPLLWGVLGGLLNFIPYLGPLLNIVIVTIVALVSFETVSYAILVPIVYLMINSVEGSLVTPALMGWRLQLNPIVIFIGLTFWTWIWGIAGALLAVPLMATIKIVCDSISLLRPVAVLMGR
jgi:predicted PurR-regulated permease PerM